MRPTARGYRALLLAMFTCLAAALAAAQAPAAAPLFEDRALLEITLRGPFEQINDDRDKEKEYPGTLTYTDPTQGELTLDMKLSVRGKFRLQKSVCSSSQLWVNLKKSQLDDTLFDQQNKLKLVVQCRSPSRYEEYIVREQQAYSMYEEVSDYSLSTRLLRVNFVDSETGDSEEQLAFFIQHQDRLAEEVGMSEYKVPQGDRERLDPLESTVAALYMFLLSNTDYSFIAPDPGENCCHNVKLLEGEDGRLVPIPYDYDSTGFVNPPYAEPSGAIGQTDVNSRMYRGYCVPRDAMDAAVQRFMSKRSQIEAIVNDTTYASSKSRRRSAKYVDKFYDIIDDPRRLEREILDECR